MSEMAASVPWSGEQLAWLQALGHTVYLDRDAVPEAPARAPAMAEPAVGPAEPAADPMPASAAPRRQAPLAPDTQAPAPAVAAGTGAAPRRGRAGLPDRLQIALLRASGLNPNDPATQTLMATWPLAELRASPAAKRALWPQLRALRRQARTRG